jgi:hypothetical protein
MLWLIMLNLNLKVFMTYYWNVICDFTRHQTSKNFPIFLDRNKKKLLIRTTIFIFTTYEQ